MSQSSSAGSSRQGGLGYDGRRLSLPYRVPPLAYEPAVNCDCKPKLKAKRWISWSNPRLGRRYLRCQRARTEHNCQFYHWVNEECSPWYKELLRDLCDAVWNLKDELAARKGDVHAVSKQVVALQIELEEKKKEAQEKQLELDVKQQEVNGKEEQLIAKQQLLEEKDMTLVAMEAKLKNKNQCIDALVVMFLLVWFGLVVVLMK